MNPEELYDYLAEMGFERNRADKVLDSLLMELGRQGISGRQAIERIAEDLRSKGRLYQQIIWIREKEMSESMLDDSRRADASHENRDPAFGQKGSTPPPHGADSPNSPSGSGFVRRHRFAMITIAVATILALLVPVLQRARRSEHDRVVAAFDQHFSVETPEQFGVTLENMKLLLENTARQVSRHGWFESDIEQMCRHTEDRYNRFIKEMDAASAGNGIFHGRTVDEVRRDLCGGLVMAILSIRDEAVRDRQVPLRSYRTSDGYNDVCSPADYRPSANMKLVRRGNEFVLLERTEGDRAMDKLFSGQRSLPPHDKETAQTPTSAEEAAQANTAHRAEVAAFAAARAELFQAYHNYRKKNGHECTDAKELINACRTEGWKISPSTIELVENGKIVMEGVGNGVTVRDLRSARDQ